MKLNFKLTLRTLLCTVKPTPPPNPTQPLLCHPIPIWYMKNAHFYYEKKFYLVKLPSGNVGKSKRRRKTAATAKGIKKIFT